ncbi:MAG: hypothetical protein M3Q93_09655 [Gemmatimonadota bacterium]|nr:hypothetical protein [Gemmatimonadota bacterium]
MTLAWRPTLVALLLVAGCGGGDRPEAGLPDSIAPPSGAAGGSHDVESQDHTPASADRPLRDPVQLMVTAEVDGARSTYSGNGECQHTTAASIYEVPASMWRASADAASGELRHLSLTLWQPKGAEGIQVSLALATAGQSHEIATLQGADPRGSGTGRVMPSGPGGSMHVSGKDAEGRSVRLTVECARWTEPVAEGG